MERYLAWRANAWVKAVERGDQDQARCQDTTLIWLSVKRLTNGFLPTLSLCTICHMNPYLSRRAIWVHFRRGFRRWCRFQDVIDLQCPVQACWRKMGVSGETTRRPVLSQLGSSSASRDRSGPNRSPFGDHCELSPKHENFEEWLCME